MGRIKKFGYAENWAQVKPLIEDGAEGIGLVKMEDQFVLEDEKCVIADGDLILRDGHVGNAFNPFYLEKTFGSTMVLYYVAMLQSINYFQMNKEAEQALGLLQAKFEREVDFYMNLNISAEKKRPFAVRLLDPEIIFTRYLGSQLETTLSLLLPEMANRIGPAFRPAVEPLARTFALLSQKYRTHVRGSDFCVQMQDLTARQIYCTLDAIVQNRDSGAETAIMLPYVHSGKVYRRFIDELFKPVFEKYKKEHSGSSNKLTGIKQAVTIESVLGEDDIIECSANGVTWFLFGTNDLTASVLGRNRWEDWGDEEKFKKELHPRVAETIGKIHAMITRIASRSPAPTYVGYAGEPAAHEKSRLFLESISTDSNIVYYYVIRGSRQICSNQVLVTYKCPVHGEDVHVKYAVNPSDLHNKNP